MNEAFVKTRKRVPAFWRGFGRALVICPHCASKSSIDFKHRGRDIHSITADQALREDWERVGAAIMSAAGASEANEVEVNELD